MAVQRTIHRRVLARYRPPAFVHGSVPSRNALTHAKSHAGAGAVYIIDLKDAFQQADQKRVLKAFAVLGFDPAACQLLSRLTTLVDGGLPQGAPTSNTLWNLVCAELDNALSAVAERYQLHYTRYTDELCFSHPQHVSPEARDTIQAAVQMAGFVANPKKTRYFQQRCGAPTITGYALIGKKVQLSRDKIDRIRGFIHRACSDTSISREEVEGRLGEVRLVYGKLLPKRLRRAYQEFRKKRG